MDSVISEKSQTIGLKAVRRRFANAKLRRAKMQNEQNGEKRSETEREPLFRAGAVEQRTIARARRVSSTAESITGELQLGLRQLDFSENGKRKLKNARSEASHQKLKFRILRLRAKKTGWNNLRRQKE